MGGGGKGDNSAKDARKDEQERQAKIREGTTRIDNIFGGQFNDDFYTGRRNAYQSYYTPQLEDQYAKAQRDLTYALARSGNMSSSAAAAKQGELARLYGTRRQELADQALAAENQARSAVEDARGNLISTLNSTGDAQAAANQALSRAQVLSAPATYSPLTNLFADFTSTLGQQAALERAESLSGGAIKGRYNTGLFGQPGRIVVT